MLIGALVLDPLGTVATLAVGWGTKIMLVAAGVPDDTAAVIARVASELTPYVISVGRMAGPTTSVRKVLSAERAARAEYDAARMAAQATEFEMSRGIRITDDVTWFKGITAEARAARPAGDVPALLNVSCTPQALALAGDLPMSGVFQRSLAGITTRPAS